MKTKMAFVTALLCGTISQAASADALSGYYNVQPCSGGEVLQRGTFEKIDARPAGLAQSLDMQGQQTAGSPRFSPLLTATIGDVIKRPTAEIVKLGYTTVDRQIASYSPAMDEFTFTEYLYDMSLTDAEGLAAGPYKTITIKANDKGLTYDLKFDDGEKYHCVLIRQ